MSNSQWYFEKHGKAEGPISTHDLARKIQDGELHLLDLVFKEGDGQWSPIESFSEITELVKTAATQFLPDADWIVLRIVNVDGQEKREQVGPFTLEQVLQLIDKGRLKFTDYVWRTGYENWIPLGQVGEFEKPLLSSVQVDTSIYEKPLRHDLEATPSRSVKLYKAAQKLSASEEGAPEEAKGDDLAKQKWMVTPAKSKIENPGKPPAELSSQETKTHSLKSAKEQQDPKEKNVEKSEDKKQRVKDVQQRWRAVASVVVLFIFLFGAGLFTIYGKKAYEFYKNQQERISFEPMTEDSKVVPKLIVKPPPPPPQQAAVKSAKAPPEVVTPAKEMKTAVKQKALTPPPPVPEVKKTAKVEQEVVDEFIDHGTPKQKSYYINSERLFLYYSSQKGLRFVTEIEKIIKKPAKKKQPIKPLVTVWLKQVRSFYLQTETETKPKRLHPQLYKKLNAITKELLDRGLEIDSQLVNGRGLAKDVVFGDIISDYKKLAKNAQAID